MDVDQAEVELGALPGLDVKGSRCVLLYSLGRAVFPVDLNTFRFMLRYGMEVSISISRCHAAYFLRTALTVPERRFRGVRDTIRVQFFRSSSARYRFAE